MSTRNNKTCILSLLFAIFAMFILVFAVGNTKDTKADDALFQFETTAYAKLEGNGGLRFRLKMNSVAKNAIGAESVTLYAASKANATDKDTVSEWDELKTANKAWKNAIASDRIYSGGDGYYYLNYLLDINNFDAVYRTTDFVAFAAVGTFTAKSESANLQSAVAYANLYGHESKVASVYPWFNKDDVDVEDNKITGKFVVTDFDYISDSDDYIFALLDSEYTVQDLKEDIGGFKFEISKDLKLTCQYSNEVKTKLGSDETAVIAAINSCKIEKLSDVLVKATLTVDGITFAVYLEKAENGFTSSINVKIDDVTTEITFNFVYDE